MPIATASLDTADFNAVRVVIEGGTPGTDCYLYLSYLFVHPWHPRLGGTLHLESPYYWPFDTDPLCFIEVCPQEGYGG